MLTFAACFLTPSCLCAIQLCVTARQVKTWFVWMLGVWAFALPCGVQAVPSEVVNTPQVRAQLLAHAPQGVEVGQPLWVGLQLTHQPEWHTYWRNPGDSGLPTQVELNLPAGLQAGEVQWPLPHKIKVGHLTNYGFEKTVLLAVPLTVSKQFKPDASQTLDIRLHANWLVCRLECIPQAGDFSLRIPLHSSYAPHAAAFDALFAQQAQKPEGVKVSTHFEAQHLVMQISGLPTSLHQSALSIYPATAELVESAVEQHPLFTQSWQGETWTGKLPLSALRTTQPKRFELLLTSGEGTARQGVWVSAPVTEPWPAVPVARVEPPASVVMPQAEGELGFALALVGAFLGGLILNLMPCVLPVLAIKLLGFAQHRQQHRAHRVAGMAYTAGVVVSFVALGATILALRAAGEQLGWGFQLQSPAVVSAMAVLFTLIALNLWGVFEFGQIAPSRWVNVQLTHPVCNALLCGVLAVAVASPCTAPFIGASMGLAMTLPTVQALALFVTMGLGLAAPYLLVSFMPAVARMLPRAGPWMQTLRQLLAFPMLATVVWLLWVLGQQTSLDTAMLALGGLLLLAALVWTLTLHSLAARGLSALLAVALVWGIVTFVEELEAPPNSRPTSARPAIDSASPATTWQPWSEASVAHSLAQGRPVFVDFTAAWCVTCQINKKSTLSHRQVLADFAAHGVTLLRADWTRRDPSITAALTALGRSGVPVYVLYAPNQAPQVLSELLSVGQVRQALSALPTLASASATPVGVFVEGRALP